MLGITSVGSRVSQRWGNNDGMGEWMDGVPMGNGARHVGHVAS